MKRFLGYFSPRRGFLILAMGLCCCAFAGPARALDLRLTGFSDIEYDYDAERYRGGERAYRSLFLQRHHLEVTGPLIWEKLAVFTLGGDFDQSLDGTNRKMEGRWHHDYRNSWRAGPYGRLELFPLSPVSFWVGARQTWAYSKSARQKDEEPRTQWEGGFKLKLPYNTTITGEHQELLGRLHLLGMGGQDPDSIFYLRNSYSRTELTHHSPLADVFLGYTYHRTGDFERDYDQDTRSAHPGEQHLGVLRAKVKVAPTVVLSASGEYSQAYTASKIKNFNIDHMQEQDGETRLVDSLMQLDWNPWSSTQVVLATGYSYTRTELDQEVDNFRRYRGGIQLTSVLTDKLGMLADVAFNHSQLNKGLVIDEEEEADQRRDDLRLRLRLISLHVPYIRIVPQYTLMASFGQRVEESTTHNVSLGVESISWKGMQLYTIAEYEHRRINYIPPRETFDQPGDIQKLLGGQAGLRGSPWPRLNVDASFRYTDSDEFRSQEGSNRTASAKFTLDYEPFEGKLHFGVGWQYLWRRQKNGSLWGESARQPLDRRDGIASFVADYRPIKELTVSVDYTYRFYRINHKTTAWISDHWEVSPRISWNFYRSMLLIFQFRYSSIQRILDSDSMRYYGMVKLTIPFAVSLGSQGIRWDR